MSSALSPIASLLQANPNSAGQSTTLTPQQKAQQQLNYAAIQNPASLNSFTPKASNAMPAGGFRRLRGRGPVA